jgi:hypothetical protein
MIFLSVSYSIFQGQFMSYTRSTTVFHSGEQYRCLVARVIMVARPASSVFWTLLPVLCMCLCGSLTWTTVVCMLVHPGVLLRDGDDCRLVCSPLCIYGVKMDLSRKCYWRFTVKIHAFLACYHAWCMWFLVPNFFWSSWSLMSGQHVATKYKHR